MLSKNHISLLFAVGFLAFAAVPAASAAGKHANSVTFLRAVNAARTARGLRPLRLDARLGAAARSWSVSLLRSNSFTHGDFAGRMHRFGIAGAAAENLAWVSGRSARPRSVVAMWLASPGHRANLLRPSYRRIGIGVARGTFRGSGAAAVVTADFDG